MKTDLFPEQVEELQTLGQQFREAQKIGDFDNAEKYLLKAWAVLPTPATDYDYSQTLSRGLVQFYRDTNQSQKAIEWLEITKTAYGYAPNASIEFLAGTVYFTAGEFDTAFSIFDKLYKQYKERPFKGEKPDYLAFYKSELNNRK